MEIGKCWASNFSSYKEVEFDFNNQGLTLICGPTGSGKSTLQDLPIWILFGLTAKNGSVDEVKSWNAEGTPTAGILEVITSTGKIIITRVRGGHKENDLYWVEETNQDKKERGKDLIDTQRLLNHRLGVNSDIYTTSTYLNEFSDTGFFFIAKAKERREIFERIADLSFPLQLAEKTKELGKEAKTLIASIENKKNVQEGRVDQLKKILIDYDQEIVKWDIEQQKLLQTLKNKAKTFESDKDKQLEDLKAKIFEFDQEKEKKIEDLVDKIDEIDQKLLPSENIDKQIANAQKLAAKSTQRCKVCKQPLHIESPIIGLLEKKRLNDQLKDRRAHYVERLHEIQASKNPFDAQFEQMSVIKNHYKEQLEREKQLQNPYIAKKQKLINDLNVLNKELETLDSTLLEHKNKAQSLSKLYDLSYTLRGILFERAVTDAQAETNRLLETYFDGEFKIALEIEKQDAINVSIQKNGHQCVYTQLSKGQRQMLRLAFSIALMKAASNQSGISPNILCFDEALDGLDSNLKVKAFSLFQELSKDYSSIFVIDHSEELKTLFDKKIQIELVGDNSQIVGLTDEFESNT